jgi:hypothetical protein
LYHRGYDLLKKLVEGSIGFNPTQDMLIFLGDYIDFRPCHGERGPVAGHTTHYDVHCISNKIIIDTGGSFMGKLTALDIKTGDTYRATITIGDFDLLNSGKNIK